MEGKRGSRARTVQTEYLNGTMKQNAPAPSRVIHFTTWLYAAITLAAFIAGCFQPWVLVPALILFLAGAYCHWFWSPVAYELEGDTLTVFFRASRKTFPSVIRCSPVRERFSLMTIRLCGNGGVFAGSGIFWNKRHGVFRAYVTRSKPPELVLVETRTRKVLISPEDPAGLVQFAAPTTRSA